MPGNSGVKISDRPCARTDGNETRQTKRRAPSVRFALMRPGGKERSVTFSPIFAATTILQSANKTISSSANLLDAWRQKRSLRAAAKSDRGGDHRIRDLLAARRDGVGEINQVGSGPQRSSFAASRAAGD